MLDGATSRTTVKKRTNGTDSMKISDDELDESDNDEMMELMPSASFSPRRREV